MKMIVAQPMADFERLWSSKIAMHYIDKINKILIANTIPSSKMNSSDLVCHLTSQYHQHAANKRQ